MRELECLAKHRASSSKSRAPNSLFFRSILSGRFSPETVASNPVAIRRFLSSSLVDRTCLHFDTSASLQRPNFAQCLSRSKCALLSLSLSLHLSSSLTLALSWNKESVIQRPCIVLSSKRDKAGKRASSFGSPLLLTHFNTSDRSSVGRAASIPPSSFNHTASSEQTHRTVACARSSLLLFLLLFLLHLLSLSSLSLSLSSLSLLIQT
jgi:hypothetical protein